MAAHAEIDATTTDNKRQRLVTVEERLTNERRVREVLPLDDCEGENIRERKSRKYTS